MRIEVYSVALAVTFAGVMLVTHSSEPHSPPASSPAPPLPPRSTVFATGLVEGRSRVMELGFELPGRIETLHVEAGQRVAEGDVLAALDSATQQAQVLQAESDVQVAQQQLLRLENGERQVKIDVLQARVAALEVELRHAATTLARTTHLIRQRAESQHHYDQHLYLRDLAAAKLRVGRAELQELLAGARAEDVVAARQKLSGVMGSLQNATAQLDRCQLRAPTAGRVLSVDREIGTVVQPTETLITFVDDRTLRVRAFVEEYDAALLRRGQCVVITSTSFEESIAGRVAWCAPQLSVKPQLRNRPEELSDVKVREVLVDVPAKASAVLLFQMPVDLEFDVDTP